MSGGHVNISLAFILANGDQTGYRDGVPQANLCVTIAQSCVSSGTHLTTQFPSHGLGEAVAYGFQTLAKCAAL